MNYFDPLRKISHNLPAYQSVDGKEIAPLPSLSLSPASELGDWEIGCWLLLEANTASFFSLRTFKPEFYLNLFMEDPEKFFDEHLNYPGFKHKLFKAVSQPDPNELSEEDFLS